MDLILVLFSAVWKHQSIAGRDRSREMHARLSQHRALLTLLSNDLNFDSQLSSTSYVKSGVFKNKMTRSRIALFPEKA